MTPDLAPRSSKTLRPIVDEFKLLTTGVPAIGASTPIETQLLRSFRLHAYICIVWSDTPAAARDLLMGLGAPASA